LLLHQINQEDELTSVESESKRRSVECFYRRHIKPKEKPERNQHQQQQQQQQQQQTQQQSYFSR